jgi:hypothetical protein
LEDISLKPDIFIITSMESYPLTNKITGIHPIISEISRFGKPTQILSDFQYHNRGKIWLI